MTNDQKVALGFIFGLAAGAVAGLLLAPSSGEETRKKIAEKATDLKEDLSSQLTSTFGKISEQVNATLGLNKNTAMSDADARKIASETVDA